MENYELKEISVWEGRRSVECKGSLYLGDLKIASFFDNGLQMEMDWDVYDQANFAIFVAYVDSTFTGSENGIGHKKIDDWVLDNLVKLGY